MIVSGFYLVLFFLSAFATYVLLHKIRNRRSSYYAVLFCLITIVCLAYFAYSIANDVGMALVANQFTFFDGTFVMMFFVICVTDICGITMKKRYSIPMTLLGIFFLLSAFFAGKNTWFYKSYELGMNYGASHLQTQLGPVFYMYVVYVIILMLVPIGVVIYSFRNRKKISYRHMTALSVLLCAVVMIFFVEEFVGAGFDILPIGYVLIEYVILFLIQRIGLYDVEKIAVNASNENMEYGCAIFDTKKRFMGADDTFKFYFPEFALMNVDSLVKDPFVKKEFVDWIDTTDPKSVRPKLLERQGKKMLCSLKTYSEDRRKIVGYVVEMRDDTEQQNHIDTLNDMNEQLANAVEEANSANKEKSRFLANMSHEIRTPVNAILGMNEIAMRECEDQQLLSYMKDIENAGKNLLDIINDILDLSKIEAGKLDILEEEYSAEGLLKDVVRMVDNKVREKGLSLNVDAVNLPSVLYGDEKHIRQVIVNLLNNAVKYTKEGTIELKLCADEIVGEKMKLVVLVKDTGIGIKEKDLKTLFESFSRADEKKNRNIEGTGLGLAITQRLVESMQGRIQVESVYGEGSTFTAFIPQKIVDATPVGDFRTYEKTSKNEKPKLEDVNAEGMKLLIVDDNPMNLRVANGLLRPTRAKVALCLSGKDCLEMIKKERYDIIFLDHMMPELDGIETLKLAKNMEESLCKDSCYVALTANAISGEREFYLGEGFDAYLSKPIDSELLAEIIQNQEDV